MDGIKTWPIPCLHDPLHTDDPQSPLNTLQPLSYGIQASSMKAEILSVITKEEQYRWTFKSC